MTVCLLHLIPAPRCGREGHVLTLAEVPTPLLEALSDDLLDDLLDSRGIYPGMTQDIFSVRDELAARKMLTRLRSVS